MLLERQKFNILHYPCLVWYIINWPIVSKITITLNTLPFTNSNYLVEGASCQEYAKLWTSPYRFPYRCSWNWYLTFFYPFLVLATVENQNFFIAASNCQPLTKPIIANIVHDDFLRKLSNNINLVLYYRH